MLRSYSSALLIFVVAMMLAPLAAAQDQSDSDRYMRYWYCRADSLTVERPNFYSDIFKAPWRVRGSEDQNQFTVIREAWVRFLVKEQGFDLHRNDALWKDFHDSSVEELYKARCNAFKTEQEAQYDKDHMESGVKLKLEGDPKKRSRHIDTGWVYSADDDNQ